MKTRLIACLVVLCSASPNLFAGHKGPISPVEIASDDSSAVLQLEYWGEGGAHPPHPTVVGTGFLIGREGYFVTAAHLLARYKPDSPQLTATTHQRDKNGIGVWFDIVEIDREHDLALCKLKGFRPFKEPNGGVRPKLSYRPITSLRISEVSAMAGEPIAIVGYPLGSFASPIIQTGNIGATDAMLETVPNFPAGREDLLIVSVAGNHGDSGCPVISLTTGDVIGMLIQYVPTPLVSVGPGESRQEVLQQSGLMVAIPARWITQILTRHSVANVAIVLKEDLVM
jgi:S1-C subfamily serine protease